MTDDEVKERVQRLTNEIMSLFQLALACIIWSLICQYIFHDQPVFSDIIWLITGLFLSWGMDVLKLRKQVQKGK